MMKPIYPMELEVIMSTFDLEEKHNGLKTHEAGDYEITFLLESGEVYNLEMSDSDGIIELEPDQEDYIIEQIKKHL